MDRPLLSVIVPVYKVEKYIGRCIQSLVGQTYENLEILLVDDGSPDLSGAICDQWAAKDPRVKVIHKENGGSGAARNTALDLAQGELIAFVDSDDYIAPEMYEYLYGILEQGADIAECGYRDTFDDNMEFDCMKANDGKEGKEGEDGTGGVSGADGEVRWYTTEEALLENIHDHIFRQLIWNKLYRRHCVDGVRFPVGTTIDDEFFTYRLLGNAKHLARSEKVLYAYRQQDDSVMHRPYSLKRLTAVQARRERAHYMEEHFPSLAYEAKIDVCYTCLFTMQRCLRELGKEDLQKARSYLREVMEELKPLKISRDKAFKSNALVVMAQWSFEGTSRFLNFLTDIHVIT